MNNKRTMPLIIKFSLCRYANQ